MTNPDIHIGMDPDLLLVCGVGNTIVPSVDLVDFVTRLL